MKFWSTASTNRRNGEGRRALPLKESSGGFQWLVTSSCSRRQILRAARRSPLKLTECSRSRYPNYSRNAVPLLLPPSGTAGSYACGVAIPRRPARTSPAIAAVRRLLPVGSDASGRTPPGARPSFPGLSGTLQSAFPVRCKPLFRRRVVCSFLFPPCYPKLLPQIVAPYLLFTRFSDPCVTL